MKAIVVCTTAILLFCGLGCKSSKMISVPDCMNVFLLDTVFPGEMVCLKLGDLAVITDSTILDRQSKNPQKYLRDNIYQIVIDSHCDTLLRAAMKGGKLWNNYNPMEYSIQNHSSPPAYPPSESRDFIPSDGLLSGHGQCASAISHVTGFQKIGTTGFEMAVFDIEPIAYMRFMVNVEWLNSISDKKYLTTIAPINRYIIVALPVNNLDTDTISEPITTDYF